MERKIIVSIFFALESSDLSPYDIVCDIRNFYGTNDCVISLQAYSGDTFICTLLGKDIVERVKLEKEIKIGSKLYKYEIVETNFTCIKIKRPPASLSTDDINRFMRSFGKLYWSERDNRDYVAVLELHRDIPGRLVMRQTFLDVVEIN